MGDQDVAHRLALQRRQQGLQVAGQVRAGIDHRHLSRADDIGAGAGEGERPGIAAITRRISGETWSQRPYSNSISRT
jgi:hypothetical protein